MGAIDDKESLPCWPANVAHAKLWNNLPHQRFVEFPLKARLDVAEEPLQGEPPALRWRRFSLCRSATISTLPSASCRSRRTVKPHR